jgi:hypothetical protein
MNIMRFPDDMIGRRAEWSRLGEFATSEVRHPTLGVVWGRRRVGKSFLLQSLVEATGGFCYTAIRGSGAEALREMGERIGAIQGAAAPLALETWDSVVSALLELGRNRECVVVLDEYPWLQEHTPELDSIIQRALGVQRSGRSTSGTRLILCGSAMSVMRGMLGGTAPLRGRAGMDLRVSPFDYRVARELHGIDDLRTALRTYAVIGGVAAYAREMTAGDLPGGPRDFDGWVCRRVLSPAAPLFSEIPLLLSEDATTSKARKPNLYHAALAGVASGNTTHRDLTSYVRIPGASLTPIVDSLTAAELVERVHDPIRDNRPSYYPGDPLIRFHYAVIRRHEARLARHDADTMAIWRSVRPTFDSAVVGPIFEAMARFWTLHFGGDLFRNVSVHVGPTEVQLADGGWRQVDVVVAADDAETPGQRTVLALGEAKSGERIGRRHLRRLDDVRLALGDRAAGARLLLFGVDFTDSVRAAARDREDVEVVDLERLYGID